MITIAKNENISELSKLRVLQQQEDYGKRYPDNGDVVYNTTLRSGIEGYICNVYTLQEYRRNGICTSLVKKCIKFAEENNILELKLTCDIPEARRIYEKHRFIKEEYIMKNKVLAKN